MGKLSDILNGGAGNFNEWWESTPPAGDFGPLPKGVYICHATKGELESSRTNRTPGYKIEFTVIDGAHEGRKLWADLWLTPAALPASKRDLAKLGIVSPAQMEQPLPRWWRCRVTVVIRRDDAGVERNEVRGFDVVGIDKPVADPFAPPGVSAAGPPGREPGDDSPPVVPEDGVPF